MRKLYGLNLADQLVASKKFVILYFSSDTCSVCEVFGMKMDIMMKEYPEIQCYKIDMDENPEAAGKYGIFAIPGILGFVEGKEALRETGYVSVGEIRKKIDRYYEIVF